MPVTPPNPPDPTPRPGPDEDLTAYLDGEVDERTAEAIEARLALDPAARAHVEGLKKAYDLLDYLPRPEPTSGFAARTLTKLQPVVSPTESGGAPAASSSSPTLSLSGSVAELARSSGRDLVRPTLWLAAALITAVAAFVTHRGLAPAGASRQSADDLSRDYPVVLHLPLYLGVDDLGYLRGLNDTDLFDGHAEQPLLSKPEAQLAEPPTPGADKLIELFKSYPAWRQQQLRKLDEEVRALAGKEGEELHRVLESYAVWLDHLPDAERAQVLSAPNPTTRLEVVKQVHQKQWRETLPAAMRAKLDSTANVGERLQLSGEWRVAEKQRNEAWALARRQWETVYGPERKAPWPFSDPALSAKVDEYVKTVFKVDLGAKIEGKGEWPPGRRLSRLEAGELKVAHEAAKRDNWFLYGLAVYRLSERHPSLPEPAPGKTLFVNPLTAPGDFPQNPTNREIVNVANRGTTRGRWPEFALEVAEELKKRNVAVPESFGPCRPGSFAEPVNEFLKAVLLPKLAKIDRENLSRLEGKWPDYPRLVMAYSRQPRYDLSVPGVSLPGAPSLWAKYYGFKAPKE